MNVRTFNALRKEAEHQPNQYEGLSDSAIGEALSAYGIPFYGSANALVTPVGQLAGLVKNIDESNEDELAKKLNQYSATSFLPGVFGYRDTLRHRLADRKLSGGKVDRKAILSEMAGPATSSLLTLLAATGLGAGIGALSGKPMGGLNGGAAGALIGGAAGVTSILAGLAFGIYKRRRSAEDTGKYLNDDNLVAKNLLVPGYGAYQLGRRARSQMAANLDA